jgi:hypothetical protein
VTLETFLKKNGNSAQPNEKIFAYKYLGVAYATEPKWSPVAESYFYQLFELAPDAHISDLNVSTPIKTLFENTKERFLKESREIREFDEFGNPRSSNPAQSPADNPPKQDTIIGQYARQNPDPIPASRKQAGKDAKIRVWPWVLGGAAIAAAGGIWWYAGQEKRQKTTIIAGQ